MGIVNTHVNYNSLHSIGHELYEIAENDVKKHLKLIFEEEIPSLNANAQWRGRRYNLLVDEFNKVIPDCVNMLELVGIEIPNSLYSIAENYSRVDTDAQTREKSIIQNVSIEQIPKGEEGVLDFKFEAVDDVKATVIKRFEAMLDALRTYETTYNKKEWSGDAETSFTGMLRSTIDNITEIFNNLSNQFSTLMQQTMDDMNNTENANTVGGAAGANAEVHVEYAALHTIGKELYEIAETEIKSVLKSVYEIDIPSLNTNAAWRGKRYNLLVKEFNNIIPQCQETIKLVGQDIPSTIYGIANNYANFDQETQRANDAVIEDITLPEIQIGDETALYFDSVRVEESRDGIVKKFAQVMAGIDAYEQKYNTRNWEGSAEQAFTTMIKKTREELQTIFDTLSTQFSTLMLQTVEDMTGTENANTVGGGAETAAGVAGAGAAVAGTVSRGPASSSSSRETQNKKATGPASETKSAAQEKDDFLLKKEADEKAAKRRQEEASAESQRNYNDEREARNRRAAEEASAKSQRDYNDERNSRNKRAAEEASAKSQRNYNDERVARERNTISSEEQKRREQAAYESAYKKGTGQGKAATASNLEKNNNAATSSNLGGTQRPSSKNGFNPFSGTTTGKTNDFDFLNKNNNK